MNFRTFYDRAELEIRDKSLTITEVSRVVPNLTLSLEEIFERWKRNLPLDIQLRNGEYDVEGRNLTDEEDNVLFDSVDEDFVANNADNTYYTQSTNESSSEQTSEQALRIEDEQASEQVSE